MSSYEDRQRRLAEIREKAQEAATAHGVPDELSELVLLGQDLDRQHDQLQQLGHIDPVGVTMFGDRPGWIDRQLARQDPPRST